MANLCLSLKAPGAIPSGYIWVQQDVRLSLLQAFSLPNCSQFWQQDRDLNNRLASNITYYYEKPHAQTEKNFHVDGYSIMGVICLQRLHSILASVAPPGSPEDSHSLSTPATSTCCSHIPQCLRVTLQSP